MAGTSTFGVSLASVGRLCLLGLLATTIFAPNTSALDFVAGSKCESVCSDNVAGTVHEDVRCLDNEFDVAPASHLKDCVTCQLNSTAVDPVTKMTDVQWGLFNLRYLLANCMFGYPEERVSISSPCQVSCQPLKRAVTFGIANSTNATDYSGDLGFCTGGQFDDFTINNCAFCYSFIPQQLILGNFLQALHIACHSAPPVGKVFSPDGVLIFNQSTIAGPTGSSQTPTKTGLTGSSLILAIVLPLAGGLFILLGVCCCCWHFTRRRRAKMAASGRMTRFYDGQHQQYHPQDFSPMSPLPMSPMPTSPVAMTPRVSPPQAYMWNEPPREMDSTSVVPPQMADSKMIQPKVVEIAELPTSKPSPGFAPTSRWAKHGNDEASTPLTSPTDDRHADDTKTVISGVSDPTTHDHVGSDRAVSPPPPFRAQDGFVREHTQGGWAQ